MRSRHRVLVPVAVLACAQAADLGAQTTDPPESCRGDAYAAYDYILGNWRNTEKDLGENGELEVVGIGESHIHEIVDGCGIVEHRTSYRDGAEHAGLFFLRAYDYERDRWNQVLVADFPGYIVWTVEPMDGRRTRFTTSRLLDGDTVHVRMTEEPVGPDAFRRTFESSRDGGRTWALDVVVDYSRMGSSADDAGARAARGRTGPPDDGRRRP